MKYRRRKFQFIITRYHKILILKTFGVLVVLILGLTYYYQKIDKLEFYRKYHREIQMVNKISNIFYLPHMYSKSKLERYDLTISKSDLEYINKNLPEVYKGNLLE